MNIFAYLSIARVTNHYSTSSSGLRRPKWMAQLNILM